MTRQEVLRGLDCLITNNVDCINCPYALKKFCPELIAIDAKKLLIEDQRIIKEYEKANSFLAAHGWTWDS